MSYEEFELKVKSLEERCERNPARYKFEVLLLASLGYVYIGIVFIALCGILSAVYSNFRINILTVKLTIPLIILVYLILRSLWIKIYPPEGIVLSVEESEQLTQCVKDFRDKLKGPKIHEVLLTDEFNAAVVQIPRLGLFGWPKNYLLVGMPLMYALSREEFRGVLAHEFGHLSGAHSWFMGWIYRVRTTWLKLMESIEQEDRWGKFIFSRFVNWYAPYLNTYTFVLARRQEYEADQCAAKLVGNRVMADGLLRTELIGTSISEQYWPKLLKDVNISKDPPEKAISAQRYALSLSPEDADKILARTLKAETDCHDTHPSLADRLAALGEEPRVFNQINDSAADYFFGIHTNKLSNKLDQRWHEAMVESWRNRHQIAADAKERIAVLDKKSTESELTINEMLERASLIEDFDSEKTPLSFFMEALTSDPENAAAQFAVGRLLLEKSEESGVLMINKAMELDQIYAAPGNELIAAFLKSKDRDDEAKKYFYQAMDHYTVVEAARQERSGVKLSDTFTAHLLNAEDLNPIYQQLSKYPEIKEAWIVRKYVEHLPESPLYVFGFSVNTTWYSYSSEKVIREVTDKILKDINFPGECFIFSVDGQNKAFKKKMEEVRGSLIYFGN